MVRGSNTFSYVYDNAGNVTRRTYPGSVVTDYTDDALNRLASVASGGQTTSYGYDVASNLTTTTLPSGNGYLETRTYDRPGRLVDVESKKGGTTLAKFALSLDPAGNPLSIVRTGSLAQTQSYTYDASDRLLSVCFQAGTCPGASDPFIRWTYDKVGNRTTERRPGQATTTYGYDFRDRLLSAGSTSYSYDQNGNELSAGTRTFTYDLANRLKTTTQASTTTTYLNDGDGVRLQASTGSQANKKTNFLWDVVGGFPQIALERDGNNALLRRYTYGLSRISMTSGSNTSYYIRDGLGSTANLTSSSGATQWTWSYEPFGSIRTETKASGSQPDNFLKFTGEYLDPTGLYHLRARQYDASVGRFLQLDPAGQSPDARAISSYVYGANRPTPMVDPSGEVFRPAFAGQATARFASRIATLVGPRLVSNYRPASEGGVNADPELDPKVWKDGKASRIQLPKGLDFFRYYQGTPNSKMVGRWVTPDRYATSKIAIDKLSLPPENRAKWVVHGKAPPGMNALIGIAAERPDWGTRGGGLQTLILDEPQPRWFKRTTLFTWGWWQRLGFPPPGRR